MYGVLCNRSEGPEKHFYEEIAEQTGGCFLHLNHFNLITQMFLAGTILWPSKKTQKFELK